MQIRMQVVSGALVVRPQGEMTSAAADELLREIEKELQPGARDVVLNMQGLARVDAGALAYLFKIQKRTQSGARRFRVTEVPESVLRLFERTHVSAKLDFAPTEADAVRVAVT